MQEKSSEIRSRKDNATSTKSQRRNEHCSPAQETKARNGQLEQDFYDLEFAARKSIRYLTKRQRFFNNLHTFTVAVSAISGSSAFISVLSNNNTLAVALTAVIAVSSTLDLVIGFAKKHDLYNDLQIRFTSLLSKIVQSSQTEENFKMLTVERLEIEKDEPTQMTILNVICHNEEVTAQGIKDGIYKISWLQKKLRNFFSFDSYKPKLLSDA